jgi:hypothetical protein
MLQMRPSNAQYPYPERTFGIGMEGGEETCDKSEPVNGSLARFGCHCCIRPRLGKSRYELRELTNRKFVLQRRLFCIVIQTSTTRTRSN